MKYSIALSALLGSVSLPTVAQSTVVLYGVADVSLRTVNNSGKGSIKSVQGGGQASSSRFGVRGTEDLGSGMSVAFTLESDVNLDVGVAGATTAPVGTFWNRMSWVSIKHPLGELRFGRDYTPAFVSVATYDPFGYISVATVATLFSSSVSPPVLAAFGPGTVNASTLARASNSVAYYLPAGLGGVYGSLMIAPSEGAPTSAGGNSKFLSGRLGYGSGPLDVSFAFADTKNTLVAGATFKERVVGGSYNFGFLRLTGAATRTEFLNAKQTNLQIGAHVPLGQGTLKLTVAKADASGASGGVSIDGKDATLLGAGYIYNLSKRTALYTFASRVANKGTANYTVPGGPPGMAAGGKSSAAEFGMRHSF